jgi:hypothetical protein
LSKGTTRRGVRIEDELWQQSKATAGDRGDNLSEVLRQALIEYNKGRRMIESTSTLTVTRPCTLCSGPVSVVDGERQRHICKLPAPEPVLTREEAITRVMDVFADRPSGPDGEDILDALGVMAPARITTDASMDEAKDIDDL